MTFVWFVFAATCRCRKRLTSSWRPFPPYVINPARSSERRGLIAPLLTDIVSVCCGFCRSHGKSFVDYEHDGLNQKSMQKLDSDLKKNLSHRTDFAFPIYGFPGQERYAQRFGYHGIVVSPGIAYIVNTKTEEKMSAKLFQNVIGCWPAIVLSALLTYVAGVLIWLLVSCPTTPALILCVSCMCVCVYVCVELYVCCHSCTMLPAAANFPPLQNGGVALFKGNFRV